MTAISGLVFFTAMSLAQDYSRISLTHCPLSEDALLLFLLHPALEHQLEQRTHEDKDYVFHRALKSLLTVYTPVKKKKKLKEISFAASHSFSLCRYSLNICLHTLHSKASHQPNT